MSVSVLRDTKSSLCVFCGAQRGVDPEIQQMTQQVGMALAENKISMICGGSQLGLMGVITDSVLDAGGHVIGILADVLENKEVPHRRLPDLLRTPCLPTRKQKMMDLSDGFLILPGGYGTMDELFEVMVVRKLGVLPKPIILMNFKGFWDATLQQIQRMVNEQFVPKEDAGLVTVVEDVDGFRKLAEDLPRILERLRAKAV